MPPTGFDMAGGEIGTPGIAPGTLPGPDQIPMPLSESTPTHKDEPNMKRTAFATALLLGLAACGGSEPAQEAPAETSEPAAETETAPAGESQMASTELSMPDWYQMDGESVTLDIVAGSTPAGNYWNYQGYQNGAIDIVVPVGANVTINFSNEDPNMAHSVGISEGFDSPPAVVEPVAVFEGAISSNPTSMTEGTLPGQSETITFTADEAGEYVMVCYIAGHAVSGMWVNFTVSADGESGVRGM
jgi:sulfocyanin